MDHCVPIYLVRVLHLTISFMGGSAGVGGLGQSMGKLVQKSSILDDELPVGHITLLLIFESTGL